MYTKDRVLAYIHARGLLGATIEEIADALGKAPNSISWHTLELIRHGLIRRGATKRPTKQHCLAWVHYGVDGGLIPL